MPDFPTRSQSISAPFPGQISHATKLFEDIVEAMGDEEGGNQAENFFLGALILTGHMEKPVERPFCWQARCSLYRSIIKGNGGLPDNIKGKLSMLLTANSDLSP